MSHKRMMLSVAFLAILGAVSVLPIAQASTYVWSKETESYRVYMEVVPAELVRNKPSLLDEDKKLHSVSVGSMPGLSHVLVWIYDKLGNAKALDVTVIAEAGPVDGKKTIKPLEKMRLSTGIVYGNLFQVHGEGEHIVALKIFAPDRSGYEEALFEHNVYGTGS